MSAVAKQELQTSEIERVPAERNGDDQFVSMIERIAMDPSLPIERLERMLAMKERMEDRAREDDEREAKKAYFAAMSKCQAELPIVTRNRTNTHTKSQYADLAAIEQQAMPIIHAHGFAVSFQPAGYNEQGELQIKWRISHADGHSESDTAGVPVDGAGSQGKVNKTGTQAFGSTATYGRRYLLCMLFNISTGDDGDGNAPPPADVELISEAQVKELLELIERSKSTVEKFCEVGKIDAVPDLAAIHFDAAKKMLLDRIAKIEARESAGSDAKAHLDHQFGGSNG